MAKSIERGTCKVSDGNVIYRISIFLFKLHIGIHEAKTGLLRSQGIMNSGSGNS